MPGMTYPPQRTPAQAQAARFLAESEAALEAVRREAGQAASEVLENVMEGVREEVAAVQVRSRRWDWGQGWGWLRRITQLCRSGRVSSL